MRKLKFEFADVKVSENWDIQYHKLTRLNPEDESLTREELEYYSLGLLTQNLLQIKSKSYLIDLGWYPDSEIDGEYCLKLLPSNKKGDVDWDKPIYEVKTRSLDKVLFSIDIITSILKT